MSAPLPRVAQGDHHGFRQEVLQGLSARPKRLPPKFLYDATGARLFEAICRTPEYYVTRTETALLRALAPELSELLGKGWVLIEPGAGSCDKAPLLFEALRPSCYMPVEIGAGTLARAVMRLAREYPGLSVRAACADFATLEALELPGSGRRLLFFPGSTLGNFEPAEACAWLRRSAALLGEGGRLLVGVDLKKAPQRLHAAYNDAAGFTAAFNLNLLARLNRELDGRFDLTRFRHHAFYDEALGRVEMHLVSEAPQSVTVAGQPFVFDRGEGIHTENSYKYTVQEFQSLAEQAGLAPLRVWTDADALFSLHLLGPIT